ncbi:MAG: peptidase domain-containing ABC transporter [Alphaproteobacteria bacterium]|nr:peptidase domain-containing ABC transporter [Alphaproteobacteria bacterium]
MNVIDAQGRCARSPGAGASLLGALVIAARQRAIHLSQAQLRRDHRISADGPTPEELIRIARANGLRAQATRLGFDDLMQLGRALPAILLLKNGSAMVLRRTEAKAQPPHIVLEDPGAGEDALLTLDAQRLALAWSGEIILIKRDYRLRDEDQPFGLRLIAAQLFRDRRLVRDLGVAAIMLSLLALGPIMFWRLLIDRVVYMHSLDTLAVLCVTMLVLIIFETAFGYMRRFLVLHITARVDAQLSTYMFNKVLNLPLDFFERSSTGMITRDMNEIFKIRGFLTGQVFGTVLDSFVLLVFLPIMFFFSAILTGVVLGFCGLICLWIIWMLPVLRRKGAAAFRAEGIKNAFLVENLQGIRTVKSLALDARQRHEWDVRVATLARLRLDEGRTANLIQTVVTPLERLMVNGSFALAVYLAITTNDQVYVGALVAFMMLTQRVAAPLVQLSQLLQQYDEAQLAVKAISNLVNQPAEEGRLKAGIRTPLKGRIEFENVRFRYRSSSVPALDGISFTAPEGTILGVMGRSGSGKTTVTRLLQMLHSNYEGLIKVDGNDLREIDVDHLRSSLGVVLQDNFLFSGTIRDAIAAAKPDASFEEIVYAARLAGAEEFIDHLPRGYETHVQEGSANLSGGQRQRLAIARALIGDPRILILDEATSALDAESEAIVNANLLRIAKGRTLVIISHRLSVLVQADTVLVLERGKIYDSGRHDELLERCDIYRGLWHQQNQHLQTRQTHGLVPLRASTAA